MFIYVLLSKLSSVFFFCTVSSTIADCACIGCQVAADDGRAPWDDDDKRQSPDHTFDIPSDLEFSQSSRNLEISQSYMQQSTVSCKTTKRTNTALEGTVLHEDVPGMEKISFEDESVSPEPETGVI